MYRRIFNFIATSMYSRSPDRAERLKLIWAIAYGVIGWNAFTLILYTTGKNGGFETKENRERFYKNLTGEDGEVHKYRMHGFTYIGKETVSVADGSIKESYRNPTSEDSLDNNKSTNSGKLLTWPSKRELMSKYENQKQVEEAVNN